MSWGWRKILQLREYVKPFFWSVVGNGLQTSMWYDQWCSLGPLIRYLTPRDIYREGYSLRNCVADLISNNTWTWPQEWLKKAPVIGNIANIQLTDQDDKMQWRDSSGKIGSFSVKGAWEALRTRRLDVAWYNVVWFTHAIPRHSFHLWLVLRNSLKTQDLLRPWDVGPTVDLTSLRCLLCDGQQESHNHLFFECTFSARVWSYVRDLAELENVPPILTDIVEILHVTGKAKSARSIIGRLIVAATTYYIWQERNNRLFNKVKRTPEEIRDMIIVTIRLKLLTFKFKNTTNVNRILQRWKLPNSFRIYTS